MIIKVAEVGIRKMVSLEQGLGRNQVPFKKTV